MKSILFIGKYPPIEGGETTKIYWLLKALGEKGFKIYVNTNALEVEDEYRVMLTGEDLPYLQPKNVTLYNTNPLNYVKFIPWFNPFTEKLINRGIEIIKENKIDLIIGWYLLPYGFVAHYLSMLFDLPYLVVHAGSDLDRIFPNYEYHLLFTEVLRKAKYIVTSGNMDRWFLRLGFNNAISINPEIDTRVYSPSVPPMKLSGLAGSKLLLFLGKIGKGKGLRYLLDSLRYVKYSDYKLVITSNKMYNFRPKEKIEYIPLVPCWKVPSLMNASHLIISPETGFSVKTHFSRIPVEAMCCGRPVIISKELASKPTYHFLEDNYNCIIVDPKNPKELGEAITRILEDERFAQELGKNARKTCEKIFNFERYVKKWEELINRI